MYRIYSFIKLNNYIHLKQIAVANYVYICVDARKVIFPLFKHFTKFHKNNKHLLINNFFFFFKFILKKKININKIFEIKVKKKSLVTLNKKYV